MQILQLRVTAGNGEFFISDVNTFGRITADGVVIFEHEFEGGGPNLYFLDDQIGFLYGPQSLLRTQDGGQTWREPVKDANFGILNYDMHFVNNSYGVLLGSADFAATGNQLDLHGTKPGIYLIRVTENGKVWSGRVVVL